MSIYRFSSLKHLFTKAHKTTPPSRERDAAHDVSASSCLVALSRGKGIKLSWRKQMIFLVYFLTAISTLALVYITIQIGLRQNSSKWWFVAIATSLWFSMINIENTILQVSPAADGGWLEIVQKLTPIVISVGVAFLSLRRGEKK